ncbi:MAG: hypothetical protein JXB19_11115, partial [Bacteroidales bacterium]|nr:hypothetical protein [Bacteroidales bacterium]
MKSIHIFLIIVFTFFTCEKENNDNDNNVVNDIDGNTYPTIKIGSQVWMAANLKVTKYSNGELIGTEISSICAEDSPGYQWACNGEEDN